MGTKPLRSVMPLDRRIRELCVRAAATDDDVEAEAVLGELRSALREHAVKLKMMLARYPVPSDHLVESRVPLSSSRQGRTEFKDSPSWERTEENSRTGRANEHPRKVS